MPAAGILVADGLGRQDCGAAPVDVGDDLLGRGGLGLDRGGAGGVVGAGLGQWPRGGRLVGMGWRVGEIAPPLLGRDRGRRIGLQGRDVAGHLRCSGVGRRAQGHQSAGEHGHRRQAHRAPVPEPAGPRHRCSRAHHLDRPSDDATRAPTRPRSLVSTASGPDLRSVPNLLSSAGPRLVAVGPGFQAASGPGTARSPLRCRWPSGRSIPKRYTPGPCNRAKCDFSLVIGLYALHGTLVE